MRIVVTDRDLFNSRKKLSLKDKRRWLKALRSGEFIKGKGRLCRNDSYCCLGVWCEINRLNSGLEIVKDENYNGLIYKKGVYESRINLEPSFPGYDVLREWGNFQGFRIIIEDSIYDSLSDVNDWYSTFNPVIHIIKKYF